MNLNERINRKKSVQCTYLNVRRDLEYSDTAERVQNYLDLNKKSLSIYISLIKPSFLVEGNVIKDFFFSSQLSGYFCGFSYPFNPHNKKYF